MYEVMAASEHAQGKWMTGPSGATEECPPDDPVDTGIDNNNEEEEKKKAEERALRMKKLLEMVDAKDRELNSIISEKMRLVGELKELIVKEDSLGSELPAPILGKENPNLPEGPLPADATENSSKHAASLEHVDAATQILEHLNSLLKITVDQDTAFQTLKTQLEAQYKLEAFSTSLTTSPSPKEMRLNTPPQIRIEPAGQHSRGSINQGGVSTTNDRVTEIAPTEKTRANSEEQGISSPSQSPGRTNNAQLRHSESSPQVNDHSLHLAAFGYDFNEGGKSQDNSRKNSAQLHVPLPEDKSNAYSSSPMSKTSPMSSPSVVRRNVPHHLLETTNPSNSSGQVRQKLPSELPNSLASMDSAAVQQIFPKRMESLTATSSKPTSDSDVIFF